jgi:hypothetical protein
VTAPGTVTAGAADAFAYPADGSAVRTGALSASAFAQDEPAQAVSDVLAVSLFNGEITADSVCRTSEGLSQWRGRARSQVTNLVSSARRDRDAEPTLPARRLGYASTLEQVAEAPSPTRPATPRAITRSHVVLTAITAGCLPDRRS